MYMRILLNTEQFSLLLACYTATLLLGHAWWLFPLLLLLPDVSMLGYLAGPRAGAITYNLFHHQGIGVALIIVGWSAQLPGVLLAGLVLLGHSAMDRSVGYGLKYFSGFQDTHLGRIGK